MWSSRQGGAAPPEPTLDGPVTQPEPLLASKTLNPFTLPSRLAVDRYGHLKPQTLGQRARRAANRLWPIALSAGSDAASSSVPSDTMSLSSITNSSISDRISLMVPTTCAKPVPASHSSDRFKPLDPDAIIHDLLTLDLCGDEIDELAGKLAGFARPVHLADPIVCPRNTTKENKEKSTRPTVACNVYNCLRCTSSLSDEDPAIESEPETFQDGGQTDEPVSTIVPQQTSEPTLDGDEDKIQTAKDDAGPRDLPKTPDEDKKPVNLSEHQPASENPDNDCQIQTHDSPPDANITINAKDFPRFRTPRLAEDSPTEDKPDEHSTAEPVFQVPNEVPVEQTGVDTDCGSPPILQADLFADENTCVENIGRYATQQLFGPGFDESIIPRSAVNKAVEGLILNLAGLIIDSDNATAHFRGRAKGDETQRRAAPTSGSGQSSSKRKVSDIDRFDQRSRGGDKDEENGDGRESDRRKDKSPSKLQDVGDERYEFMCPFRLKDPLRFNIRDWYDCAIKVYVCEWSGSKRNELNELRRHLKLKHSRPGMPSHPYCSTCKEEFPTEMRLDEHARQGNCTYRELSMSEDPLDGITPDAERKLSSRQGRQGVSPMAQYRQICQTVFGPNCEVPSPGYRPVIEHFELHQDHIEKLPSLLDVFLGQLPVDLTHQVDALINEVHHHTVSVFQQCTVRSPATTAHKHRKTTHRMFLKPRLARILDQDKDLEDQSSISAADSESQQHPPSLSSPSSSNDLNQQLEDELPSAATFSTADPRVMQGTDLDKLFTDSWRTYLPPECSIANQNDAFSLFEFNNTWQQTHTERYPQETWPLVAEVETDLASAFDGPQTLQPP